MALVALMWGSSFMWMEVALESFSPPLISFLRLVFGFSTLALFPAARIKVEREAWPKIVLLGVLWMAFPFLLFPIAQQWIDSSVAGMINGAVPIFAGIVAAMMMRRLPTKMTIAGIGCGFVGVVAVSWPAAQGAESSLLGVGLVLLASIMYGVALNLAAPLQNRYGALPVLLRAQMVALAITAIPGLVGATSSEFEWKALLAIVPLGCLGSALAFVGMTTLVGRVGPARGSVTIYFVPIVAIVLGTVFENETIAAISLAGTALVLVGAYLASRKPAT
jgi:drug/metabolite transporter (DMT)-like permease